MFNSKFKIQHSKLLQPLLALSGPERRIALSVFLWGLGEGMWLYVQPLYIQALGGSVAQIGLALGIIALGPVLVMLPVGRRIDRAGPRGLMRAAWAVGLAGAVASAAAPDWRWLVPALTLFRISAFGIPALNAYVAQGATLRTSGEPPSERNRAIQRAIAAVNATYYAALIFSPFIGGLLAEAFGLRTVFWLSVGWFVLSAWAVYSAPKLDAHMPPRAPAADSAPWWKFTAAQRRVYILLLALFLAMALGYALTPKYLADVRGLPLGIINGLGGVMVWTLWLGRLTGRRGLLTCTALMAAATAGLLAAPGGGGAVAQGGGVATIGGIEVILLAGVYFAQGAYQSARTLAMGVVNAHMPPERRGTGFGLMETIFGLGGFIGPLLAGQLYVSAPGLPFALALTMLLALLPLGWFALAPPQARHMAAAQPAPAR